MALFGGEVGVGVEDLGADEVGYVGDFEDCEEVFEGAFLCLADVDSKGDIAAVAKVVVAGDVCSFHIVWG